MAIEWEIANWEAFRNGLGSEDEKSAFDAVMDLIRNQAMAGGNAFNPVLFESMVMSALLGQQKQIRTLQRKIDALLFSTLL